MPQRILIQTTIPYVEDDWHVGRFSLLAGVLQAEGHDVTMRDRATKEGTDDPVFLGLLRSDRLDQLWLIAVDTGNGLTPAECAAISDFRSAGGSVLVARDHMDLGSSVSKLPGIGDVEHFHTINMLDEEERIPDDIFNAAISWPNFHSGPNGDVQRVDALEPVHPTMRRPDGSVLETLPSHPHEGCVAAPPSNADARVIAVGTSKVSGKRFNIAVAIEAVDGGRAWAESTFHHFADYNWNPRLGSPSFVTEEPSEAIVRDSSLLDDTRLYVGNIARWLGQVTKPGSEMSARI